MEIHISSLWPLPASSLPRPQPEGPHWTTQSSLKSSVLRWAGFPCVDVKIHELCINVSDTGAGHRDVLSRSGVSFWQRREQVLLCLCRADMRSASWLSGREPLGAASAHSLFLGASMYTEGKGIFLGAAKKFEMLWAQTLPLPSGASFCFWKPSGQVCGVRPQGR